MFLALVRFSRLATGEERPESAAEESRDAPFLRFSSFPPFIRAPVVDLRPVSWFLLCHTRPYTYIHRGPSFYTGLSGYITARPLSLFPSLFLSSEPRDFAPSRRDYKSSAIKTVVRRFDGPCQDALSSQYRVTCTCGTPGILALYINVLWSRPD